MTRLPSDTAASSSPNLKSMNIQTIRKLQRLHGYAEWQKLIDNGTAWVMEGYVGRTAMDLLEQGACMLPKKSFRDYYGNRVPSRDDLKSGTKGTYQNTINFFNQNFLP
jgi:hypothetical protein